MNKYLLKHYIKSGAIICFILLFAIISTWLIYNKFNNENSTVDPVDSFEVTFHEKTKDKITLTKANPVSDAIGLASNAYTITIINNTDQLQKYQIRILDDEIEYQNDACLYKIPKESLKIAYHKDGERNEIKHLSELMNNVLTTEDIMPLSKVKYTIRLWVDNDNNLNIDKDSHYHGLIKVEEIN